MTSKRTVIAVVGAALGLAALRGPAAATYSRSLPPAQPASSGSQLDPLLEPNEQARIDIIDPTAPVDTTGTGVWQNVLNTPPGSPGDPDNPMAAYATVSAFVPGGRTVRLRFAEVDNQSFFNFGIDDCSLEVAGVGDVLVNGSFESNGGAGTSTFTGWTTYEENLSSGAFFVQTGTDSPLNSFTVPPPPDGSFAAMSDQFGPGLRIIYQDIAIPPAGAQLTCQYFIAAQAPFAIPSGTVPAPALAPLGLVAAVLLLMLFGRRIAHRGIAHR